VLKPRSPLRPRDRQGGVTLVELLVVVSILAVGAMLAAPDLSRMVAGRQVQSVAQNILEGLNTARAEAVRRNTPVRFSLNPAGNGWTLVQPSSGATLRSYASSDWGTLVIASADALDSVTFLPNGLRQSGPQLSQVTVSSPLVNAVTRRINVFGGGLIRMCDPAVTASDDPRRC